MSHSSNNQQWQARREAAVVQGVGTLLPVFIDRAHNAELWDVEGNRYIDFASGIAVLNTGHNHPKVVAAVREQAGIVDIYVSNAGVPTTGMGYGKFLESKPEDWERFVKLNMYGLMNGCHAVLPGMIEQGYGRVIAITSESWRAGVPMGIAAYAASKAGVVGFVRQLAAEMGRKGITVNALSLGTMNNWDSEEMAKKSCFVPRAGSPADVGAGVAYLASREASWVTGQVHALNGGSLTA